VVVCIYNIDRTGITIVIETGKNVISTSLLAKVASTVWLTTLERESTPETWHTTY